MLVGAHHFWILVGDVYHYLPEVFGRYHVGHQTGHVIVRLMRHTPDLHVTGKYTYEGYAYSQKPVQDVPAHFFNQKFFHTTFLPRSSNTSPLWQRRIRYQFGSRVTADYPEVFYLPRPIAVRSPWTKHSPGFWLNALWQTPLKILKNTLTGTPPPTNRLSS